MGKKVKPAQLEKTIGKILDDFREGVLANVEEATKKVGKAGAAEMRRVSADAFGTSDREKPYARGWTYTDTGTRVSPGGSVWNRTNPGLVHLLENGHAIRRGGRTVGEVRPRPHVKGVSDEIDRLYEKEVADAIRRD